MFYLGFPRSRTLKCKAYVGDESGNIDGGGERERKAKAVYKGCISEKLLLWATTPGALETVESTCFGVTAQKAGRKWGIYPPTPASQWVRASGILRRYFWPDMQVGRTGLGSLNKC